MNLTSITLEKLENEGLGESVEINIYIQESKERRYLDDVYDALGIGLENHSYLRGNVNIYENISEEAYKNMISKSELGWSHTLNKISTASFNGSDITNRSDRRE